MFKARRWEYGRLQIRDTEELGTTNDSIHESLALKETMSERGSIYLLERLSRRLLPRHNPNLTSNIIHLSMSTTLTIFTQKHKSHSIIRSIFNPAWYKTASLTEVVQCSRL